jgi:NADPH:quinone reductase-like Zn-dependent oxidoreductase
VKAIVQDRYGPPSVLQFAEVDKPVPGDDDLLLRVHAAGVDPSVWHFMTGLPYMVRLMAGLRRPKDRIRGWDVAGRVEAVGKNVSEFRLGDEVFGACRGSFAEYALAQPGKLAPKPERLDFQQAAVLAISGSTALEAVRDKGNVQPGQHVLVIGAAGGVGTFAVQIAKALQAEVTGVCSTSKLDLVRGIGADHVIDYTREDFADGHRQYDVILDTAGRRPLAQLRRALSSRGTLVLIGGEGGNRWVGGLDRMFQASMLSRFTRQNLVGLLASGRKENLLFLRELVDTGKLTPVMDRTYPLGEAREAVRVLAEGHARGKIVLAI